MSETNKTLPNRWVRPCSTAIAVLSLILPFAPALGEGIPAYGLRMCENAGIPANECTLAGGSWPEAEIVEETASAGIGGKAETLDAHAALLCEQQGVPLEDCVASRPSERLMAEEVQPASAFVTPTERLPKLTATPLPEPVQGPAVAATPPVILASPPRPVQQQTDRFVPPPAATPRPQAFRELGPSPPQAFREAGPPPPALWPPVGQFALPPQPILPPPPAFSNVGPPPARPVFRDALGPLPAGGAPVRGFHEPRAPIEPIVREVRRAPVEDDDVGFFESLFDGRQTRCRREVRYSRPPSYRYVECF